MGLFSKKTKQAEPAKTEVDKKTEEKKPEVKKEITKVEVKKQPAIKSAKKVTKPISKKSGYGTAYRILLRPVISEKATMGGGDGKYVFEVDIRANKIEVKKAVEEVYGVTPRSVNIINQRGYFVRFGRKQGHTKNIKKAIVTLKKGDSITVYEGI